MFKIGTKVHSPFFGNGVVIVSGLSTPTDKYPIYVKFENPNHHPRWYDIAGNYAGDPIDDYSIEVIPE